MASITEHVIKLQELTQKNLDILQALNDSFFTNQNHLSVAVGENQYAIPSFISLENKLNSLIANFENLVNAPSTGEAFFDFNGNSKSIQVRSYTTTPSSLIIDAVTNFNVEQNDIFKDFLTPNPYIHINLQSLPNDITQVLVKKIIPKSDDLKDLFASFLTKQTDKTPNQQSFTSIQYDYKDLYKILDLYKQDVDYIEYDTKLDMPVRKSIGSGMYVIEEIIKDEVDENLDNYITIKFRSDMKDSAYMNSLKYRLFDETIEKMLSIGDQLITFEGNAKMEITEIHANTNTVVVKVLHGDFLNLAPSLSNNPLYISSLSKVKFFSPINFDNDKYIKIPLEEDQYVFIAVAALNPRMNVQSPWGTGIMLNSYSLENITENGEKRTFKKYYDENVRNVGDILFEITSMMSNTLTKYSKEEYEEFTQYIPTIDTNNLQVVQINKHLNNSITVQNIRAIHAQKIENQTELVKIQNEISAVNDLLSKATTKGDRQMYMENISSLNTRKNILLDAITKNIQELSQAANNSDVPIENAKYRIRGFFDTSDIKWDDHIKGIRVQYRYKNADVQQSNAMTFNEKFIFSDWNEMSSNDRERIAIYEDNIYKSKISPKTDNINEPSFNQIDIPITQGESIDIRLKVVYDFGDPFVQTSSKWSQIVNISFPTEFTKDVNILDIIDENNKDIETNRFTNIIKENGITSHIEDRIKDQDITYYHKPENIASGFYTDERRIIPLKDKLAELNNLVIQLKDEILGSQSTELKVALEQGGKIYPLEKLVYNNIFTDAYSDIKQLYDSGNINTSNYQYNDVGNNMGYISTVFNLTLTNESDHIVKLYSMFPGDPKTILNNNKVGKFNINDYCKQPSILMSRGIDTLYENNKYIIGTGPEAGIANYEGVWLKYTSNQSITNIHENAVLGVSVPGPGMFTHKYATNTNGSKNNGLYLQTHNQFIYFRMKDIYSNDLYKSYGSIQNSTKIRQYVESLDSSLRIGTQNSLLPAKDELKITFSTDAGSYLSSGVIINENYFNKNMMEYIVIPGGDENPYLDWDAARKEGAVNEFLYDYIRKINNCDISTSIGSDMTNAFDSQGIYYTKDITLNENKPQMWVYPELQTSNGLCVTNNAENYLQINPKDKIVIPFVVEFFVSKKANIIKKTISFDMWTSLYKDPINYSFTINAKYENTVQDKIISQQQSGYNDTDSKYNVIYK